MYGIINKFISHTVISRYGEEQWEKVKLKLTFETEEFVDLQPYSDDVTFGIVTAAVNELNLDPALFLEELGYDWVLQTAQGSYKEMYSLVSGGIYEFIENLNNMHQLISAQLTELIPPTFVADRDQQGTITLKYFSERDGLDAFVIGLLKGLCTHFNEPGVVELISAKGEHQAYSVFRISF